MDLQKLLQKSKQYYEIYPHLTEFEKKNLEESFLIEYTHDSTAIEGNTLTLLQTKMILSDGIVPAETTLRELDEVRSHAKAWDFVKRCAKENRPFDEKLIKDIHWELLPQAGVGGIYRNVAVIIKGSKHISPSPTQVYSQMGNFVYEVANREFDDEIEKAAWIHAEFVKIHPFIDGNGRTARLLMNYHLITHGYPATSIKAHNKEQYFDSLEMYALTSQIEPFKTLLCNNLLETMEQFINLYAYHLEKS